MQVRSQEGMRSSTFREVDIKGSQQVLLKTEDAEHGSEHRAHVKLFVSLTTCSQFQVAGLLLARIVALFSG
jgi:hypothetical protein